MVIAGLILLYAVLQSFGSLYFSEIVGVSWVSGLFAPAALSEIPSMLFGIAPVWLWSDRRFKTADMLDDAG